MCCWVYYVQYYNPFRACNVVNTVPSITHTHPVVRIQLFIYVYKILYILHSCICISPPREENGVRNRVCTYIYVS
jgi:hypothetical protein